MFERIQSDFLFAQPSFASGVGSTVDLWGGLTDYNGSTSSSEADANALAADWFMVGQDIFDALQSVNSRT